MTKGRQFHKRPEPFRQAALPEKAVLLLLDSLRRIHRFLWFGPRGNCTAQIENLRRGAWRGRCSPVRQLVRNAFLTSESPRPQPADGGQGAGKACKRKNCPEKKEPRGQFMLSASVAHAVCSHLRSGKFPCLQICFQGLQAFSSLWQSVALSTSWPCPQPADGVRASFFILAYGKMPRSFFAPTTRLRADIYAPMRSEAFFSCASAHTSSKARAMVRSSISLT